MPANDQSPESDGHDHVQAALDASCAALLALESAAFEIRRAGGELEGSQAAELQAIELVRSAIFELRRSVGTAAVSPLAYGFVRARAASDPSGDDDEAQTSSFRIA
jgi:hypothetical protein